MKLNLTEKETCPRCGAKFDCGKSGKCWCFEVDVMSRPPFWKRLMQNIAPAFAPIA